MANEPIQGLPYPELTGVPPNVPEHIKALADAVAPRTVMRFASLAARDAALPSPVDGMVCYVAADNGYYVRVDGQWRVLWAPEHSASVATSVGSGSVVCTLRNGWVCLTISISSAGLASGGTTTVANVPAPFRPASNRGGGVYLSAYPGAVLVTPSGDVQIANQSGAVRNAVQGFVVWPEGL